MLRNLFFAAILLTTFAACKSKAAFNYSQDFVTTERSLVPEVQKTEESVKTFFANKQYDSIGIAGARMEKLIDSKLNEIKDRPAPDAKDAESFKGAIIKYFEFIKSMYSRYREYGNAPTQEGRDEILVKLQGIVNQKTAAVSEIQQAQKRYADANGFRLEK